MDKPLNELIIAVDFDGTCVTHEYPNIGRDIGAGPVLLDAVKAGARLILYTMRSGAQLTAAMDWFLQNGIPLWSVNSNPLQSRWTDSPKVYAHVYIDDAALGAPLVPATDKERAYINWHVVRRVLFPEVSNGSDKCSSGDDRTTAHTV